MRALIGLVSYQTSSLNTEPLDLKYTMENRTALEGQLKAKFWVSCNDTDDMDISLSPCKVDKAGKIFEHIYVPWHALPTDNIDAQENVPNYNTIKVS